MPRYPIDRATNFIVEQESWTVVQYDHTSVPGVIYLSLTEGKINSIYDDVANNLADTDKIANYQLSIPTKTQNFEIGEKCHPAFTLTKNGIPSQEPVQFSSNNTNVVKVDNGELIAVGAGKAQVIVTLINYPTIYQTLDITVGEQTVFSAYLEGPSTLRLDRETIYTFVGTEQIQNNVIFSLDDNTLATIINIDNENHSCKVKANAKNKLGKFVLTAEYNGIEYTKEISVIPLW